MTELAGIAEAAPRERVLYEGRPGLVALLSKNYFLTLVTIGIYRFFGRDAESAADAEAVTLMSKAGLDVAPFGAFFERLQAEHGDGDIPIPFLRTHPPSDQRAKLIEAAPAGGAQALTPAEWQDLKAICSAD